MPRQEAWRRYVKITGAVTSKQCPCNPMMTRHWSFTWEALPSAVSTALPGRNLRLSTTRGLTRVRSLPVSTRHKEWQPFRIARTTGIRLELVLPAAPDSIRLSRDAEAPLKIPVDLKVPLQRTGRPVLRPPNENSAYLRHQHLVGAQDSLSPIALCYHSGSTRPSSLKKPS